MSFAELALEHSSALVHEAGGLEEVHATNRECEARQEAAELEEDYTLVLEHMERRGRRKRPHHEKRLTRLKVANIVAAEELRVFGSTVEQAEAERQGVEEQRDAQRARLQRQKAEHSALKEKLKAREAITAEEEERQAAAAARASLAEDEVYRERRTEQLVAAAVTEITEAQKEERRATGTTLEATWARLRTLTGADDVEEVLEWWTETQETHALVTSSKESTEARRMALEAEHARCVHDFEGKDLETEGEAGADGDNGTLQERIARTERRLYERERQLRVRKEAAEASFHCQRMAVEQLHNVLERVVAVAKARSATGASVISRSNANKQQALYDDQVLKHVEAQELVANPPLEWLAEEEAAPLAKAAAARRSRRPTVEIVADGAGGEAATEAAMVAEMEAAAAAVEAAEAAEATDLADVREAAVGEVAMASMAAEEADAAGESVAPPAPPSIMADLEVASNPSSYAGAPPAGSRAGGRSGPSSVGRRSPGRGSLGTPGESRRPQRGRQSPTRAKGGRQSPTGARPVSLAKAREAAAELGLSRASQLCLVLDCRLELMVEVMGWSAEDRTHQRPSSAQPALVREGNVRVAAVKSAEAEAADAAAADAAAKAKAAARYEDSRASPVSGLASLEALTAHTLSGPGVTGSSPKGQRGRRSGISIRTREVGGAPPSAVADEVVETALPSYKSSRRLVEAAMEEKASGAARAQKPAVHLEEAAEGGGEAAPSRDQIKMRAAKAQAEHDRRRAKEAAKAGTGRR